MATTWINPIHQWAGHSVEYAIQGCIDYAKDPIKTDNEVKDRAASGEPLTYIPREIFTSSVAVVDQDIILFQDSISNKIKTWDKSIKDFEVILAARDAQLHGTIIDRECFPMFESFCACFLRCTG